MTDDTTRVPDDEYEAAQPDQVPLPAAAELPPENLVDRAVERAAEKVAAVTVPGGEPVMHRTEAFICVAALIILNLAALFVGLQTRNDIRSHRADFKEVCQLIVERTPEPNTAELARRLADCLK